MKYKSIVLANLLLSFCLISCDSTKTVTTESGLKVEFVKQGEGEGEPTFKENDIVLINMLCLDQNGNEIFNTTKGGMAMPMPYNEKNWSGNKLFYDALKLCKAGDSIHFSLNPNELFVNTVGEPVPDTLAQHTHVTMKIGVEQIMTMEEFGSFRNAKMLKFERDFIDKYLLDSGMVGKITESGLTYVINQAGTNTEVFPVAGNTVAVHYKGAFMDGTVFDSSLERGPFEFVLGQGQVIKGWDEGVALLNVGSKATFVIPSALAYGERGYPGAIPPNSILRFDIELLEIKK